MNRRFKVQVPSLVALLLVMGLAGGTTGCASMAEKVAEHLAAKDVKALGNEFTVFGSDLVLFRSCLKERGGTCQGSDATALPHSSQAVATTMVPPARPGSNQTLSGSVATLPAGDPAKDAHAVLSHPVNAQAAALHNHLRGHDTGSVPGFSVKHGVGDDGTPESTATMSLGVTHVEDFHGRLLSSVGTTAWESLHGHCEQLLAAHGNAPGKAELEAECRRVAFIRGYLDAYFRAGEFVAVDVQLAGAIQSVQAAGSKIETDIENLQSALKSLQAEVAAEETKSLADIGADASSVGSEVKKLVSSVESDLTKAFGKDAADIFADLSTRVGQLEAKSEALAQVAGQKLEKGVKALVAELDLLLDEVASDLGKLKTKAAAIDQKVVADINTAVAGENNKLSNVFKVSKVGFVSRDETFRARLPTLEVTLDPTVKHLVTVTDEDDNETLTGSSRLGNLGVATDTSGVGTGNSIGAEVVRVLLEAIFDAHEGLPAVAAVNLPDIRPTGLSLGDYSLPLFTSPLGNIDSGDLTRMTHTNDQVAAKTRAIMSRVLAGIGPFSLDNQPLEDFLVEIITTSVRQATAKATWCWYACDLNTVVKTLETDAKTAVDDKVKAEEDKLEAKAKKEEGRVKDKAEALEHKGHEESKRLEAAAKRVKLRLELKK